MDENLISESVKNFFLFLLKKGEETHLSTKGRLYDDQVLSEIFEKKSMKLLESYIDSLHRTKITEIPKLHQSITSFFDFGVMVGLMLKTVERDVEMMNLIQDALKSTGMKEQSKKLEEVPKEKGIIPGYA